MSLTCGKCTLDLSKSEGYVKCLGCYSRYHFNQCSGLSPNTWKAKSQQCKEEWRCESCRKKAKEPEVLNKPVSTSTSESSALLKHMQESFKSFFEEQEVKTSILLVTIEKNVQTHLQTIHENMESLVRSLVTKIDDLSNSFVSLESNQKKLMEDNSQLRSKLDVAHQKILSLERKMPNSIPQHVHNATTERSPNVQSASTNTLYSDALSRTRTPGLPNLPATSAQSQPSHVTHARSTADTSATADSNLISSRDDRARGNLGPEGWQTVSNRRQQKSRSSGPPPKIGTKSVSQAGTSSVPMVRPREARVRTSSLFITRFSPVVTAEDIKGLLTSLSLSHLVVSKLKTRYQESYSSFHVEVLESDFVKIDDENVWPDGCLIKRYQGRLKPDVVVTDVLSSDNTILSVPTNGGNPTGASSSVPLSASLSGATDGNI